MSAHSCRRRFPASAARWTASLCAALLLAEGASCEEPEPQLLRERLTEREDENRLAEPTTIDLFGRPLIVSGETELSLDYRRHTLLGGDDRGSGRTALEFQLEAEVFYSVSENVLLFAQGAVAAERLVTAPRGTARVQDSLLERGEMWISVRHLFGRRVHLQLGSLDFDDDRTWWWDEDLDGVRIEIEGEEMDLELSLAREIMPRNTARGEVEPEHERVTRLLGEFSWDFAEEHTFEMFGLHQMDHSPRERVGALVDNEDVDEFDARLTWLGARLAGAFERKAFGLLGYWVDLGAVRGKETRSSFGPSASGVSVVNAQTRHDVRGWGMDVGVTWAPTLALDPRFTLGLALGSGDVTPDGGNDRAFRQTGIQGNESGLGGVQRFDHYGLVLRPELSNLRILRLGFGISLLQASSLDFVALDYRQREPTRGLRDSALELTLNGRRRHVGSEFDLVLALEEWEALEAEIRFGAFRPGSAVGSKAGWSYAAFVAARFAF